MIDAESDIYCIVIYTKDGADVCSSPILQVMMEGGGSGLA